MVARSSVARLHSALFSLAVALLPASLAAQSADVRVGDRVRLAAPTIGILRLTGLVTRTSRDTMVVEADGTGRIRPIATDLVTRLDVSLGRTPRRDLVRQGVLAGGAAGAVVGATVVLTDDDDCRVISSERRCDDNADDIPGAVAIGAVIGAVLGGAYGLLRPAERWVRIDPPIRLGVAPMGGGAWRVAMRVSF